MLGLKARDLNCMMDSINENQLQETLVQLRQEHRDLDNAINALEQSGHGDQLQLKRLKKKKLCLKDQISEIEDQLFPDIIA